MAIGESLQDRDQSCVNYVTFVNNCISLTRIYSLMTGSYSTT